MDINYYPRYGYELYGKSAYPPAIVNRVVGKVEFRVCAVCGKRKRSDKRAYHLFAVLKDCNGKESAICAKCQRRLGL